MRKFTPKNPYRYTINNSTYYILPKDIIIPIVMKNNNVVCLVEYTRLEILIPLEQWKELFIEIKDKKERVGKVELIINKQLFDLNTREEKIVKMFHTLYERDVKTWRESSLESWVKDLIQLEKMLENKTERIVAIYTEIAMQKIQAYRCDDFQYKTYFSISALCKKQKDGLYVYEKILEIAKERYDNNQKFIEEYNKNLNLFNQWN